MLITLIILFIILFIVLYKNVDGNKKYKYFVGIFLITQYLLINSNPYKDPESSKLSILEHVPDKYKPKTELYNESSNYKFPFILKPNVCTRVSAGVEVIKNKEQLEEYFETYDKKTTIYQEFIPSDHEIGVLYERFPLIGDGKIVSIVKRDCMGNENFAPVHEFPYFLFNSSYSNRKELITPELSKVICNISKRIPDYYCGRYDIRYDNEEDLKKGKNFYILEANGNMGFDLRKDTHPYLSYKSLYYKLRFLVVRLWYGLINIMQFNNIKLGSIKRSMKNCAECSDWEKLYCVYS